MIQAGRRVRAGLLALCAGLAAYGPGEARAQEAPSAPRPPQSPRSGPPLHVQRVLDLAYELGTAHALRRACSGAGENGWRLAMEDVIASEHAEGPLKGRMTQRFNAGYETAAAAHPQCGPASMAAERAALRAAARVAEELSVAPQ